MTGQSSPDDAGGPAKFSAELMYEAARLYYLLDLTQADVASRLATSRATVGRLLSEARRTGIVTIDVQPPRDVDEGDLADSLAQAYGLERAWITPPVAQGLIGSSVAPRVADALLHAGLGPGDVLVVASGRTVYETARAGLPSMPGVVVVPGVGGLAEPEPWYQSNEITREVAARIGGHPTFLHAPALPSEALRELLLSEPTITRVLDLWGIARCALVGIGAPPLARSSISASIPTDAATLRHAVGDICLRFFDREGHSVEFPGSDRMMSTSLDVLREIPTRIAVAAGGAKVAAIAAAARRGYINQLVTDRPTAQALMQPPH